MTHIKMNISNRSQKELSPRVIPIPIGIVSRGVMWLILLCSFVSNAQISSGVDTTQIRIGEEIKYTVSVQTDSTDLVVFPEGQTFCRLK